MESTEAIFLILYDTLVMIVSDCTQIAAIPTQHPMDLPNLAVCLSHLEQTQETNNKFPYEVNWHNV